MQSELHGVQYHSVVSQGKMDGDKDAGSCSVEGSQARLFLAEGINPFVPSLFNFIWGDESLPRKGPTERVGAKKSWQSLENT